MRKQEMTVFVIQLIVQETVKKPVFNGVQGKVVYF